MLGISSAEARRELKESVSMNSQPSPRVCYIKLGMGGEWETECINEGIIRIGFQSQRSEILEASIGGNWPAVREWWLKKGKSSAAATSAMNQWKIFFEDRGDTIWITFNAGRMYWGSCSSELLPHQSGEGTMRRILGGWCYRDNAGQGEPLSIERLAGSLTRILGFRGTVCVLEERRASYVLNRIKGDRSPEVDGAVAALANLQESVRSLLTLLGPKDFELLVDLVFARGGWQRLGAVGQTQKTIDIDLVMPITGERCFVQVKSDANQRQLDDYVQRLEAMQGFERMFFVHHSGSATTDNPNVTVIGPERLASLVVDAGLTNWLIEKVA
jgi:hypothetical protein